MNELCIGFIEKELWFYSHSFSQQQWCTLLMTLEQANSSQFQVLAAGGFSTFGLSDIFL